MDASLKHVHALVPPTRSSSDSETPDDLYGKKVKFTDVLHFSSSFTNAKRFHCEKPRAHPLLLDFRETYLENSKFKGLRTADGDPHVSSKEI